MQYFTSDTHFFHKKVIEYCNRPFRDVEQMNEYLVYAWNTVVMEQDAIVNFVGDFSFGTTDQTKEIFGRLKGRKRLIVGNHDKSRTKNWWRNLGFEEVVDSKIIQLGKFEATNVPTLMCTNLRPTSPRSQLLRQPTSLATSTQKTTTQI